MPPLAGAGLLQEFERRQKLRKVDFFAKSETHDALEHPHDGR
jgi:hypothetical protein